MKKSYQGYVIEANSVKVKNLDADYAHLTIKELTSNKEPFYDYSTSK